MAEGGVVPGLVSVVLPVHNRPDALREAADSVYRQSYPYWELIIVDDGSSDETGEVAEALARREERRTRVLTRPNGGPGAARESGRLAARGEFIQYLDSDDLLLPRKLELMVAALSAEPGSAIAYCACRERGADGKLLDAPLRPSAQRLEAMFPTFLLGRWWNTIAPLYRARLCAEAGPWLPLFQEEDWELDARIAALGPRLVQVEEVLAEHRHGRPDRLSGGGLAPLAKLRARAAAHESILASARAAGIGADAPEMRRFARELFLLARQCGAAGMEQDSERLFGLARQASGPVRAHRPEFVVYHALAAVLGWRRAALLARRLEGMRGGARTPP